MGSNQSSDTLYCNRYLNGQGPLSLEQQAHQVTRESTRLNGCQPEGQMTWEILNKSLPGYHKCNTVQINYTFPDGLQKDKHPHPGKPYPGLQLCAYLPDNNEGNKVLNLLEKAFEQQLLFTIATNENCEDVIATSIPLKTQAEGGNTSDGYPDPAYMRTVTKLLKNKGIH
ncbi:E3 ubiquitin-protein ligase DTX3L1 [Gouania willdenowi]|uniref:E3 ubiquitin-protein ligase DTX3L1 n=1 Tax=Gouania willdenowi TaxID=441366 RepID=UPI0010566B83|nr:E3 ubiquitin-protein ligase DTX3L-like [Gouania willdenowi]